MSKREFDVAIVGASTAGCTAARLLALAGARVALIERKPAPDAYKTVCTHFIQSSAAGVIRRLGLAELIEARGANRNRIDMWTPYGGWIRSPDGAPPGYNVTRRTLDPLLRELAVGTPGVEYLPGWSATAILGNGRPSGIEIENRLRERRWVSASLVVDAGGRDSAIAAMVGIRGRVRPHNRFFYWAYWHGVRPDDGRSRMWFGEPDCAYTFPNEDGLTVVLAGPHRARLPEWRGDLEAAYARFIAGLPDAPDLRDAERESKLLGKLDLPSVMRPAARPGVALVGDSALATDPLWGVGCGWAFQSAAWLADEAGPALVGGGNVDAALDRYRRIHRRRLGPHHFLVADLASGRMANPIERRLYRTATRDPFVRARFEEVGSRRRSPARLLDPRAMARMVRAGR